MGTECFDGPLPDDQMLARLRRRETFLLKLSPWQIVERQVERLGFEDSYFVTQVKARRGQLTKVTPVVAAPVRRAA